MELEKEDKKKKYIIGALIALVAIALGFGAFFLFSKKEEPVDNGNGNETVDAVAIAKAKLDEAKNFLGSFTSNNECENKVAGNNYTFCYYDTFDSYKTKFYNIYASSVELNEVYIEHDATLVTTMNYDAERHGYTTSEEAEPYVVNYVVKDDNVYLDNECRATGADKQEVSDFTLVSEEDNKIIVSYKMSMFNDETEPLEERIVLVKENNDWKVEHAAIFNKCGTNVKVGK